MSVEQVIVNPESLQEVSQQFKRRAVVHQQNLSTIIGELNSLRSQGPEGWIGDAANQHFMEMEQFVLPGYKRLIEALNEATLTMKFTQNEFNTADQEGSKAFKQLDSTGNAEAEGAIQRGGSGTTGSIDAGAAGQGSGGSGDGSSGGGGGQQGSGSGGGQQGSGSGGGQQGSGSGGGQQGSGSGGGQQGSGSGGGQQGSGSGGSLGSGSSGDNASAGGTRSGGAVSQANGGGSGLMAGVAAVAGTVIAGAKMANDMRNK